jgi:hypothetical protein
MANPKIEVEIGAQTDGLNKGLNESQSSIDKFAKKIELLNAQFKQNTNSITALEGKISTLKTKLESATNVKSIEKYQSQLDNAQNKLIQLGQIGSSIQGKISLANQQASQSFGGLTKSVGSANGVAVEFSRIIQDSPFGIIGIGNNIQQLTANFAQLRSQTTSTGAALSSALGALISPANLLVLGISAVTAGFTAYQMGAFKSKDSTKELIKEVDRLNEASSEYLKTLSAVGLSQVKGSQNATAEIASLRTLYNATQDTTLSLTRRQKAVDALQDEYPNVFKNIKDEIILNGGARKSYDDLTTSILANAKAKAAESTLVENEKKLIALQNERESVNAKIAESEKRSTLELKDQVAVFGQFKTLKEQQTESEIRLIEPSLVRRAELGKEINKITADNLKLTGAISAENSNIVVELGNAVDTSKELKRVLEDISKLPILGLPSSGDVETLRKRFEQLKTGGQTELTPEQGLDQAIKNAPGVQTGPTAQMDESMRAGKEAMTSIFKEIEMEAIAFNEMITQTLSNGISNAITDLAFSIGEALATGDNVFSAIGQSLLNSIGAFLGDLGAQLIQVGVAGLAFATLLETIKKGGPAAIPAAIGAIAIGIALTAASGAFRGLAGKGLSGGGGGGGGSSSVGAGVSSQSFGGSGFTSNAMNLNGEFTVRGTDLVYVLNRVQDKNAKG